MLIRSLAITLAALAFAPAAASAQLDHRPVRFWEFTETRKGQGEFPVGDGSQHGGRVAERHVFGNAVFDYLRRPDGLATGEVNSSPSGKTFDVYAQSPSGGFERAFPIGGASHLDQYQSYEKQADQASMRFQITQAVMSAIDVNGNFLPSECPPRLSCLTERAKVRFFVRAYAESAGGDFFRVGGVAFLHGHQGVWDFDAVTLESAKRALWNKTNFFFDRDLDGAGSESHALAELLDKVNVDIDLSSLRVGELFADARRARRLRRRRARARVDRRGVPPGSACQRPGEDDGPPGARAARPSRSRRSNRCRPPSARSEPTRTPERSSSASRATSLPSPTPAGRWCSSRARTGPPAR